MSRGIRHDACMCLVRTPFDLRCDQELAARIIGSANDEPTTGPFACCARSVVLSPLPRFGGEGQGEHFRSAANRACPMLFTTAGRV